MRIAVITGASSGIGREFVRQIPKCYKRLDEIWLVARSTDKLKKIKEETEAAFPVSVRIFDGDLLRDYIFYRIKKELEIQKPDIRMLVNGAGFGKIGMTEDIAVDTQTEMIDLNCKALTRMTCLCLPYLSKGSRVLNIASASAFLPQPQFAVYAASKSYVLSFSRGLSMETAARGIVVTAVCPGPVDTPFFEVAGSDSSKMKKAVMVQPGAVVRQALWDTRNGRDISVFGMPMKGVKLATKILPDRILRIAMMRIFNTK
ncbi:SDR family NAD(P)-dependent oxidoreductase [Dorea acetigenes]|uniref:SDR family NAD(P)-dependent oxidoreductase n=1 Tax=Dorea acetigenes TaxID=2981787 RepID=A0ABT2RJ64_9FIRM|nr:SDR family NAD(P)-dependent oxidoreductase [Dorea acetigenes]MCU6685452.1 SDR family NAD(P)-dependent oxidoreductase [Dorea acetigenes]SCI52453.1 Putative ketoacyl reductase [uncultured Clostridium sp.]